MIPVKVADDTRLVAFVVAGLSELPSESEVATLLAARVPSYMIPTRIVARTRLPLTASGKPDRPLLAAEATTLFEREPPNV